MKWGVVWGLNMLAALADVTALAGCGQGAGGAGVFFVVGFVVIVDGWDGWESEGMDGRVMGGRNGKGESWLWDLAVGECVIVVRGVSDAAMLRCDARDCVGLCGIVRDCVLVGLG